MEFNKNNPIYLQIADLICEKILLRIWKNGERIPSVRDFASELEVNPNTMMRTYAFLQEKGIIVNQRGIGFFIAEKGYEMAKEMEIARFFEEDIIKLNKKMNLLGIKLDDIVSRISKIKNEGE